MTWASVDGRRLAYTDEGSGEGPALVFLHFFGGSSRAWGAVTAELAPRFRCVAVDAPGFGRSDPAPPGVTVRSQAEAISNLLDQLGLGPRVLVGHSMGGKLALAMAARHAEQVKALVLVASSPPGPEPGDAAEREALLRSHGDRSAVERLIDKIARRPLQGESREQVLADHLNTSAEAWRWWLADGVREDLTPHLEDLSTPTFVVSGALDPVFPPDDQRRLGEQMHATRHHVIEAVGHLIPLEAPQELAALLSREFQA